MNNPKGDHGEHGLDGEVSRPIHQFILQTTAERGRLRRDFMALGVEPQTLSIDINTMAHNNIRNVWIKQKIWDEVWVDILPGLRWEHERRRHPSVSEISSELLAVQASLLQKYSREVDLAKADEGKVNYSEAAMLESEKTPHTMSVPEQSTSTARHTPHAGGPNPSTSTGKLTAKHTIRYFEDGTSRQTTEHFKDGTRKILVESQIGPQGTVYRQIGHRGRMRLLEPTAATGSEMPLNPPSRVENSNAKESEKTSSCSNLIVDNLVTESEASPSLLVRSVEVTLPRSHSDS